MARQMKAEQRRAVASVFDMERHRRGYRLVAVMGAGQPKPARGSERETSGAINSEGGWNIHCKLLLLRGAAEIKPRYVWEEGVPRVVSGGTG
jgi:hypothetical protein